MNKSRMYMMVVVMLFVVVCLSCGSGNQPSSSSSSSSSSLFGSGPSKESIIALFMAGRPLSIDEFNITNSYERDIIVDGMNEHAYFIEAYFTDIAIYLQSFPPSEKPDIRLTTTDVDALIVDRVDGYDDRVRLVHDKPVYCGVTKLRGRLQGAFFRRGNKWMMTEFDASYENGVVTPLNQEERKAYNEASASAMSNPGGTNNIFRPFRELILSKNAYPREIF